jgi:hypothetical protein
VLGQIKTLIQRGDRLVVDVGFATKPGDQGLLTVLPLTQVADVAVSRVRFGVQPPKLWVLLVVLLAHGAHRTLGRTRRGLLAILSPRDPLSRARQFL